MKMRKFVYVYYSLFFNYVFIDHHFLCCCCCCILLILNIRLVFIPYRVINPLPLLHTPFCFGENVRTDADTRIYPSRPQQIYFIIYLGQILTIMIITTTLSTTNTITTTSTTKTTSYSVERTTKDKLSKLFIDIGFF